MHYELAMLFDHLVVKNNKAKFIRVFNPKSRIELQEMSAEGRKMYREMLPDFLQSAVGEKLPLKSNQLLTKYNKKFLNPKSKISCLQ